MHYFFNAYAYLLDWGRNTRSFRLLAQLKLSSCGTATVFGRKVSAALPWCWGCSVEVPRSTTTAQRLYLCLLPSEHQLLPRFAWNPVRWEALKQAQVRHPLVSRMFLGLCVIRDPVAWRWFIPVCRASLELLEAFYQPSVVPDEFWWAVCRQHLCDIFSGSWFCGLNSNWWSL